MACFFALSQMYPAAWRWFILSGVVLSYGLWVLWRGLILNHRPQETTLFPTLGLGNHLSMFRALVIGLLAGFLFLPKPQEPLAWIIAILFTAASIADWLDGYAARRAGQITILGQKLDMEFDGLAVAVISFLAVRYGQLPAWFMSVGLARYFFLFGIWWREKHNRPCYDMPPSVHRRIMAGMLMGMMTVVLWPIVPAQMSTLAGFVIAIPVLLGFLRDWLFTSGHLQAENPDYHRIQHMLYISMARWFPLIWRLLLAFSMVLILQAATPWYQPRAWQDLLVSWHVPLPGMLAVVLSVTAVTGTILSFFGFMGRIGAIILFFPIGFDIATRGLVWFNGLALVCAMCIALLGTGMYSLWQPEEAFIVNRRGGSAES